MEAGRRMEQATRERIARLAIGEAHGYTDTARLLATGSDGRVPVRVTPDQVRRVVQRLRRDGSADTSPRALAERMLRVLERELAAVEQSRGRADLERLDRLAATLRRLEPLRAGQSREISAPTDLRSLMPEGASEETEGASDASAA